MCTPIAKMDKRRIQRRTIMELLTQHDAFSMGCFNLF